MPRHRDMPIVLALFTALGGVMLVAVVVIVFSVFDIARRNTHELIRERAALVVNSLVERTRNHLDPVRAQVEYVAAYIVENDIDIRDTDRFGELLAASLAAVPQVSAIAFIDPGLKALRAFRNRPGTPVRLDDWSGDRDTLAVMLAAKRSAGAQWGELFVAEGVGRTLINVRIPVRRRGVFLGILVAGVSTEHMSDYLGMLGDEWTYNTFILSGPDRVLAHPLLMPGYPGLTDQAPLPSLKTFGDPILYEIWSDRRRTGIEQAMQNAVQVRVVELFRKSYVFLYTAIDDYGLEPWLIGTYLPLDDAAAQLERLGFIPLIGAGLLVVFSAIAFALARGLARPARRLAEAARRLGELDFDAMRPLERGAFRELNQASASFDGMIDAMRVFATYVPRSLVRRLIREHRDVLARPRQCDVTVLFTDIVGFTRFAETRAAQDVAVFLNQHFTLLAACVEAEGGTVDKYIGDALMAFWGAPDHQPDHAARACRAAAAISAALEADNQSRRLNGDEPVRVRIGIQSGPVVVGNIGAPGRMDYTIVGDAVNTAERLEELSRAIAGEAPESHVIVGQDTAARLPDGFALEPLGAFELRGRHDGLHVHVLKGWQRHSDAASVSAP